MQWVHKLSISAYRVGASFKEVVVYRETGDGEQQAGVEAGHEQPHVLNQHRDEAEE